MKKKTFNISEIRPLINTAKLINKIENIEGISKCEISFLESKLFIEGVEIDEELIENNLRKLGLKLDKGNKEVKYFKKLIYSITVVFMTLALMLLSFFHNNWSVLNYIYLAIMTTTVVYLGSEFIRGFFYEIIRLDIGRDLLITLGMLLSIIEGIYKFFLGDNKGVVLFFGGITFVLALIYIFEYISEQNRVKVTGKSLTRNAEEALKNKSPLEFIAEIIASFTIINAIVIGIVSIIGWIFLGNIERGIGSIVTIFIINVPILMIIIPKIYLTKNLLIGEENGIIFKSSSALEQTGRIATILISEKIIYKGDKNWEGGSELINKIKKKRRKFGVFSSRKSDFNDLLNMGIDEKLIFSEISEDNLKGKMQDLKDEFSMVAVVGDEDTSDIIWEVADLKILIGESTNNLRKADVIITKGIKRLKLAFLLGDKTVSQLKSRLVLIFIFNAIMIPLSALGIFSIAIGGSIMFVFSAIIILCSNRSNKKIGDNKYV